MSFVLTTETIIDIAHQLRKRGERVTFTHGAFDIFHKGHSMFLEKAKRKGEILIVGIDPNSNVQQYKDSVRPVIDQEDRMHMVSKHKAVDFVFLMDEIEYTEGFNPRYFLDFYKVMQPNHVAFGRDFKFKKQFENKIRGIKYAEIKHKYNSLNQSTTNIISSILKKH